LGLRPRLLALLAALLSLAFGLVYFAISTYTEVALQRADVQQAVRLTEALGSLTRAVAMPTGDFKRTAEAWRARGVIEALVVWDAHGTAIAETGDSLHVAPLLKTRPVWPWPETPVVQKVSVGGHPHYAIHTAEDQAFGSVLLRVQPSHARSLYRLIALYLALVAIGLLVAVYFAATRWVLSPLDALARAAEQVAAPSRRLVLPQFRTPEFAGLARSLAAMTERLLAEEHSLRDRLAELERAREQLSSAHAQIVRQERLASVGQLAAGLAHEVGNPLAAIQGLLDLLLNGELDAEQRRDFLQRVLRETERINRILRDLLQFARQTGGTKPASTVPGDLGTAIQETLALLTPQPSFRDMNTVVELEPDLPSVTLEHEQIVQVLLNLLLNSAHACGGKGRVLIAATHAASSVTLVIEDDGPGVAPDLLGTLFEPFVSSKEVGTGTGLGLSVCRGLVEDAGGSIQLDSEHRKGARFVVTLPAAAALPPA
jgi:two-component system, NtrC family, sensor kinase